MNKMFDLNTEKILTGWRISEAIRELISNSLDEQKITNSKNVEVTKVNNKWVIRDYGRGLNVSNLTQNESEEKLSRRDLIGKFGFGLKDSLATLNRNNIDVNIKTSSMLIDLKFAPKSGFEDIKTLHAAITPEKSKGFKGTEIVLSGVKDGDIKEAKEKFLIFNDEPLLDSTRYGEVVKRGEGAAKIYINGVCVAYEDNFAFSYNITSPPKSILKHLNRERNNVGRVAYTDIIKKILLSSTSQNIAEVLFHQFSKYHSGESCDELGWSDIQEHAVRIISSKRKAVFITHEDTLDRQSALDEAKREGFDIVYIPSSLSGRLSTIQDFNGASIRTVDVFVDEMDESFEFDFVSRSKLTDQERKLYDLIPEVLKFIGGKPKNVKDILISNTMRKNYFAHETTQGLWDSNTSRIILHRSTLKDPITFLGTLAHEIVHAKTGYDDVSREFEHALTDMIGVLLKKLIS